MGEGGGGDASSRKRWNWDCRFHLYHRADSAPFFLSHTFWALEFTAVLELEKGQFVTGALNPF